ncbi:zinc-binding alcohol dehydrogenase [Gloeophyllum trabeum ATCC 11539]|uniref:Zinc-binding alcohol dehydrogenase n=1 Tax=Gloeophyllum trabeum (strain ATCC 11539 / FP-39264 / Madison 617) TaxID=670483 RepID=S7QB72_GLOTA|nr:zinc-binding alcohol dehydrogenase [Gloeophyllum trabeum ATCC 11539]EPQ57186.1 zinc-binding alcohol dehydrogenase [Gloeophyllum trabeum ATCC 11539]
MASMKAVVVENYGGIDRLEHRRVPKPASPTGRDILVRVLACSVNPIDMKVRAGRYDDYPDYYDRVPRPYQICGFDAAGIVEEVGKDCTLFKPSDEVFYSGSPVRQGSNAEWQLVDERSVGRKPHNLSFVEAAAMPLTYVTAYEALVERMEIRKGERAGLLIINGAGGVGSVASQIARTVLQLPVVVTTASRPETQEFTKAMGATHVINHRKDLKEQIDSLRLEVPIRYIFITHSTDQYMDACAKICEPLGKVCSIVQGQARMYGTPFMAKSLAFIWEVIGTKPYYGVDLESQHRILTELADLVEEGSIRCHLTQKFKLSLEGLREGHAAIEKGGSIGKIAFGVDEAGDAEAFA